MTLSLASRVLLRWSWVALFFWFGSRQLINSSDWVGFLPEFTGYLPIPGEMLVQLNGLFEIVLAVALLFGVYTRVSAALLAVHLMGIAVVAGGAIGVRDAALAMVGFAIALDTPDAWTMDAKQKKQKAVV